MTNEARSADRYSADHHSADHHSAGSDEAAGAPQARFEFLAAGDGAPAVVRVAGDIDLTNVGQFQSVLFEAAATGAINADLTAVTYCDSAAIRALFIAARQAPLTIEVGKAGPLTETLLNVSGLDQIATVITLD